MGYDHLREAISEIPDTPCEKRKCEHTKLCSTGQACPSYWWYSHKGTTGGNGKRALGKAMEDMTEDERFTPSVEVYNVVFPR